MAEGLSPEREAVLLAVRDSPKPVTIAALASITGRHENTVRGHLDALVRDRLLRRRRGEPHGRGRPAWRYEVRDVDPAMAEYVGLASALASAINRTSSDPAADAIKAGEEWGHQLARERGAGPSAPVVARSRAVAVLKELGFSPEPVAAAPAQVRLTRCPLLDAARRHPKVICNVHVGIVRGVLEEQGCDPTGIELLQFSEPGACRLIIPPLDSPTT